MRQGSCGREEDGFTLIELLVVVIIIGILLAIAAPSFLGQQDKAKNSAAQQSLAVVTHEIPTLYNDQTGGYASEAQLVNILQASEPQFAFHSYNSGASPSTGERNISVVLDSSTSASVCAKSSTGIFYCARVDKSGTLLASTEEGEDGLSLASLDPTGLFFPDSAQAAAANGDNATISRCTGTDEPNARACLATSARIGLANPGASPGWTSTVVPGLPAAPTMAVAPSIVGSAQQAQTLSGNDGVWNGSPTSYSRAWWRCDTAGSNCVAIAGATSASYLLTAPDVGSTIRFQVIATNAGGAGSAFSNQTAVVTALFGSYTTEVSNDGPSAQCRFNESGTSYVNTSCIGISGQYQDDGTKFTLQQAGAIIGDSNKSAYFTGTTHYTYANPSSASTNNQGANWSAEAWVRPATSSPSQTIISADDNWALRMVGSSGFACDTRTGSPWAVTTITGGAAASANSWYYVVCTYSSGTLKLYVNGAQVATQSGVAVGQSGNGNVRFGYTSSGWTGGSYLQGRIDEFSFYKSTLSAARVLAHYNSAGY